MEITIDDKVKKYLRDMDRDSLTIYIEKIGSCWQPTNEVFVKTMKPEALEDYVEYQADGINIFFHKEINISNTVEIRISEYVSDLPNKEIEVKGIEL